VEFFFGGWEEHDFYWVVKSTTGSSHHSSSTMNMMRRGDKGLCEPLWKKRLVRDDKGAEKGIVSSCFSQMESDQEPGLRL
jgi:hypothetical protein